MAKEKPTVPVEHKPKKAGTLFATLMAIISLVIGIYLIMRHYGLYKAETLKNADLWLAGIMILTGLSSLAQVSKILILKRIERIKGRYI